MRTALSPLRVECRDATRARWTTPLAASEARRARREVSTWSGTDRIAFDDSTPRARALALDRRVCVARILLSVVCASRARDANAQDGFTRVESASGWNVFESDGDSLSPRPYALEWPSGWSALEDVSSARSVGVDASFKDFNDEASTLAVFITDVKQLSARERYGTLEEDARLRAESAPNQRTIGKKTVEVRVGDRACEGHQIETLVGGGTAGRFGAAVELVKIWIDPKSGKEYLIRATASRSSWPRAKASLRRSVDSFRFVN
jgi:hypothetical protein